MKLTSSLRDVNVPWEVYAEHSRRTLPHLSSGVTTPTPRTEPTSVSDLAQQNNTLPNSQVSAEARRMMVQDDYSPPNGAGQGLSFDMLAELISEGRGGEVPGIRTIPDEINVCDPLYPSN